MNDGHTQNGGSTGSGASPHVINLQGSTKTGGSGSTQKKEEVDFQLEYEKYQVPADMIEKHETLIKLVIQTESMTDDERLYWFQIMPVMSQAQLDKFKGILETEKKQLEKLDQEYETQLKQLNERHLSEWQAFEAKEKKEEIKKAEMQAEASEKAEEEALLKQLDEL